MFDLGMSELLVVGAVGLIVIGPKDLPEVFRQLGRFTARARQMGREFTRAMEQAADEAGVKDVASDLNKIANPKSFGVSAMKDAVDKFEKWDPMANAAKPSEDLSSASITADSDADFDVAAFDAASREAAGDVAAEEGPETRALREKQEARRKVIEDGAARLKAIDAEGAGTTPAAKPRKSRSSAAKTGAKTAGKTRAKAPAKAPATKTAAKADGEAPAKTPRRSSSTKTTTKTATRTTKAADKAAKTGARPAETASAEPAPASKPAGRARKTSSTTARS